MRTLKHVLYSHYRMLLKIKKQSVIKIEDIILSKIYQSLEENAILSHLRELSKTDELIQAESTVVAAKSSDDRKMGNCFSLGMKLQLCRINTFLKSSVQYCAYSYHCCPVGQKI